MATNFWEKDAVVSEQDQWWKKDSVVGGKLTQGEPAPEQPKDQSAFRQVADVPLSLGRGALSGVRMIADAFGAGSKVSETIKGAEDYIAGLMSAQAKNDQQEIARIMKDAEDKGVADQVKAALKAFTVAPVDLISQGLGTAAPGILGVLGSNILGGGALAARLVGAGIGAGMGAGTIKGGIYEETKKALKDAGMEEAQAEARAQLAQSYGGENLDQILMGTAFGGLASATGIEKTVAGPLAKSILRRAAAKEAVEQAPKTGLRAIAGTAARGAAAEAAPEFLQAAQEQAAKNIALQREGFETPTMRGVIGSGVLEALAGAGLGAGFDATAAAKDTLRAKAKTDAERILAEEAAAAEPPAPVTPPPAQPAAQPEEGPSLEEIERRAGIATPPELLAEPVAEEPVAPEAAPVEEPTPPVAAAPAEEPAPVGEPTTPVAPAPVAEVAVEEEPGVPVREEIPAEFDRPRSIAEEMEGVPAPRLAEVEQEVAKLAEDQKAAVEERTKLEKRTAGTSLMQVLKGTLNDNELSELGGRGRKVGKNQFLNLKASKDRTGSSMEDMVDSGALDIFLPERMRSDHPDYVNSESAEYIREKLRSNQFYTYETELAIETLNRDIEAIERQIQDLLSDDEINKEIQDAVNEQRELAQADQELAPAEEAGAAAPGVGEEEILTPQTEEDLRTKAEREQKAARAEEEKRKEEDRKAAAPAPEDFVLTGSDRDADEAAARGQMDLTPAEEPAVAKVSPEEERKTALQGLNKSLSTDVPPFRARGGDGRVTITRPKSLSGVLTKEVYELAKDLLDLGLPASVLGNIKAAGQTRTKAVALVTNTGWLLIGGQWSSSSKAERLQAIAHELGHTVDTEGGAISKGAKWAKAHKELMSWYANSESKFTHPLAYPFAPQYRGKVRMEPESFAQAFGYYFTSPVDLQKNAPEAYSQIQQIIERIQDGSQRARAAGATTTGTAGIKIQPARAGAGAEVQPEAGAKRADVGATEGRADRGVARVGDVEFFEDIPNDRWLQEKIDYAQRSPRNSFGVPKMSSVTGRFKNPVLIPARWFKDVKGQRGEEKNVRQKDLEAIRKIIRETGKFPLNDDGTEYVPYIEIGYDGKPWISEGNHRIMAAIAEGMEYIPVELRYFDGGQRRAGVWNPGNVASITENVGQETADINMLKAAKEQTESPEFKRWSKGLPVYESAQDAASDRGVFRLFHATPKSFKEFKPGGERPTDSGPAIWMASSPDSTAATFRVGSEKHGWKEGANIMPVYVRIERPLVIDSKDMMGWARSAYGTSEFPQLISQKTIDDLIADGYDSIIAKGEPLGWGANNDEYIVFDPKQIKSAVGNIGTFDPDVADINMMQAPEKGRENILGEVTLGNWTLQPDTKQDTQDSLIYKMLDKNIDLKRVIQSIKAGNREILTRWNPYLKEELYHGRTAYETKTFRAKEVAPLVEEMDKAGVTIGELEQYLHNRHAEAYNKHVAKVNPNTPEMQDGGSGIATEDARKYLADLPADKKKLYESLAKRIDEITKGTRELLVESGLEKRETIDAWEKTFPDYVPLMREEEDFEYTTNSFGVGQGFDVRGSFSKRAMGSKRNVVDILANAVLARERAIVKAEKNRVAQAVYGLAIQNGNPNFWMAVNPMAEKIPQVALDDLARLNIGNDALEFLMKEPRQRAIDPKKNEVISRVNSTLRNSQYVLSMRLNGEDRYVFFNPNNERAKRAATALKNLDAQQLGAIMGFMGRITRYMAAMNTQYNPIFGAYNFLRDVQGAAFQLSTTPIAGKQKEVGKNVLPAMKAIFQSLRKGEPTDTEMGRLWEDFQKAGGQTGFRDMYSRSQDRAEALLDEFKKMSEGRIKKAGRYTFQLLSDYNDTMENAVRLSAYKVALENGFNKDEAASIAKNLTVNFNRKGDIAVQAGALYAFFNASMQGTARLIETLKGPLGKKIIYGGLLWGVMQSALLAAAGFDEEEPPEFVRERNFIIPIFGTDKYIAFPMPLGYHVIPGFSRSITDAVLASFGVIKSNKTMAERVTDLTGMFLEAFNPIGNAGWSFQTLAPTPFDPIVALFENRDWTGKKISKQDFSDQDPTPGYTRAKESATYIGTQIAKFLNLATGGTKYQPGIISPTPEQLEYLAGQAFGGVGREVGKIVTTAEKLITGEELPPYKIPLAGRFYGETKSSAAEASRFYKNLQHLNKLENEIKGRRDNKEPMGTFMSDNPEARLIQRAESVYSDVKKLRERKEKLVERGASRESVKAVENLITAKQRQLNEQMDRLRK